jgi:hypothetical protein
VRSMILAILLSVGAAASVRAETPAATQSTYCEQIAAADQYSRNAVQWALDQHGYPATDPRARDLLAQPHSVAIHVIALARLARLRGDTSAALVADMMSWNVEAAIQEDVGTSLTMNEYGRRTYQDEMVYCNLRSR